MVRKMGDRYWNSEPKIPIKNSTKLENWKERSNTPIDPSTIPRSNVQPVDPPNPKMIGKPIRLKSNQVKPQEKKNELLFLNIQHLNWKGHENYSNEQLMELNETIHKYMIILEYCLKNDIPPNPRELKKYSVKELKKINQESEKLVNNWLRSTTSNKAPKRIKKEGNAQWLLTNPEGLKEFGIKNRIKKFVTVPIDQIPPRDLIPLENRIERLKEMEPNLQVSSLDDAKLLILNHELKSYNEKEELTIDDARKSINCYKSKKIIKEKYPEIDLPNNCKSILKMYNEMILPKDYPKSEFSQEQVDQWNQEIFDKRNSGDQLHENTESDIY